MKLLLALLAVLALQYVAVAIYERYEHSIKRTFWRNATWLRWLLDAVIFGLALWLLAGLIAP